MTSFVPDIDRGRMGSPDRVDALVWALTELLIEREPYAGLMEYIAQQMAAPSQGGVGIPAGVAS